MEKLKLIALNELIAQTLSFLILLFLLRKFFWGRILSSLDERRRKIGEGYKAIEEGRTEVERLKVEYQMQLNRIDKVAQKNIQEAVREGKRLIEEARKDAHVEAQEIIEAAKRNVKYELAKVKETLRDEIVDVTVKAAEKVIEEKLTAKGDRELVQEFIQRLSDMEIPS